MKDGITWLCSRRQFNYKKKLHNVYVRTIMIQTSNRSIQSIFKKLSLLYQASEIWCRQSVMKYKLNNVCQHSDPHKKSTFDIMRMFLNLRDIMRIYVSWKRSRDTSDGLINPLITFIIRFYTIHDYILYTLVVI